MTATRRRPDVPVTLGAPAQVEPGTPRPPRDDEDLRFWLSTMTVDHRYDLAEVRDATGLPIPEIEAALARLGIDPASRPDPESRLRMRPYPGGRHPRSGYREAAGDPHRETKLSVFTPWDDESYVVMDAPEAVFSNLGLLYLAHRDVETIWDTRGVVLPQLEWTRGDGMLSMERELPNGVRFGTVAVAHADSVRMEVWLENGTDAELTGLRLQNCLMLKGANGFQREVADDRVADPPYLAAPSHPSGDRWVITAWEPVSSVWANPPCPCLHSDPTIPDCPPGETRRVQGRLSFFEGRDIRGEFARIDSLEWWTESPTGGATIGT